jgi:hypothetical protein
MAARSENCDSILCVLQRINSRAAIKTKQSETSEPEHKNKLENPKTQQVRNTLIILAATNTSLYHAIPSVLCYLHLCITTLSLLFRSKFGSLGQ